MPSPPIDLRPAVARAAAPPLSHEAGGVRMVAGFEAAKGALVLLVGCGLLALAHQDLQALGERLVTHLHLNPASRYPRIFLHALAATGDARLGWLMAGALVYALLRFVEAWGLWHGRGWAQWLAVASGAIYLPLEVVELARGVSALKLFTFGLNLAILAYLTAVLRRRLRAQPPGRPAAASRRGGP